MYDYYCSLLRERNLVAEIMPKTGRGRCFPTRINRQTFAGSKLNKLYLEFPVNIKIHFGYLTLKIVHYF